MAHDDDTSKRVAAPYISYQTLRSFVGPLKEHVVPNRIDKSLLKNFSGAVQSQLMTALKFLRLIDADSRPTDALKSLVSAHGTEEWAKTLNTILKDAYPELFVLPLATASPSEFNEAFKAAYPCEGETLRKGVTFFLNAGREAGVGFSPFLSKGAKPRAGTAKRRVKNNGRKADPTSDDAPATDKGRQNNPDPPKSISEQLLSKFPAFDPAWPDDLKAKWFAGYEQLLKIGKK